MNLAFLTGLGNGAVQGIGQGLDLRDRLDERKAAKLLAKEQMGSAGLPPVTLPGATPMTPPINPDPHMMPQPQPPMPGQASMPATPPPAAPPPPMTAPAPGPVASAPLPAAAPPGAPPPPQVAPQSAAGAPANPQQSGVANPSGSQVQDAQTTVRKLFMDFAQANPTANPMLAFKAVNQQIKMMQGVGNEARLYMQYSNKMAELQFREEQDLRKAKTTIEGLDIRGQYAEERARISAEARRYAADQQREGRTYAADQQRGGREYAADKGYEGRVYGADKSYQRGVDVAGIQGNTQRDVADTRADASDYNADQRYRSYVNQEAIRQGTPPPARAVRRAPRQRTYLGQDGNPVGGGQPTAASPYKSPQDVRAAYQAGRLSRDQAAQVLRQNGWAQ